MARKTVDLSAFKPGQALACTVESLPHSQNKSDTIARLMRLDGKNAKALRTAQRMRKQREIVYNRGNRDWTKREKPARVVQVEKGASWTLPYSVNIAPDLASIAQYLSIKPA